MESDNSHLKINWYRVPCDKDLLRVLHKKDDLKALSQSLCYLSLIICTGLLSLLSFDFFGNTVGFLTIFLHGTICAFTISAVHELIHGTPFKDKYLNSLFCSIFAFVGCHNHYAFGPATFNIINSLFIHLLIKKLFLIPQNISLSRIF